MKTNHIPLHTITGLAAMVLLMVSCSENTQSPGVEYMPDMYRGPAIEAYIDYGQDPYHYGEDVAAEQRMRPSARVPAEGTIPYHQDSASARINMPYSYPNSNEGYEAAGLAVKSPIEMTEATVTRGKVIYDKFCNHCHGPTGQGDGPVVSRGGHPPPTAYNGPLKDLPEGKMFHVVTYGKGMMGPHAPLLNKTERWLVVQYVKYLQAGEQLPGGGKLGGGTATAAAADSTAAGTGAGNAGAIPAAGADTTRTNTGVNAPAGTM
ncbi:MAG: cytochrome c [Bacteroidota bacterium]|nr:cytochrome c [Bacteroidota bacterium]